MDLPCDAPNKPDTEMEAKGFRIKVGTEKGR